jgi:hypothetical protein
VQVPYGEGVATRIGPEPCADVRKGAGETSAGECTGQPLNRSMTHRINNGCALNLGPVGVRI